MNDVDLIFADENEDLVVIMGHVVSRLLTYRQLSPRTPESAGVLIGERRGSHIVIYDISEPGFGDIRQRCRVERCGLHHQKKVDVAFEDSKGRYHYLGEWHTHPEDVPFPSMIDNESWRKNLVSQEPLVLLIVGRKNIWLGKKDKQLIVSLKVVE